MVLGVFLCIYFSYHALHGQRSFSRLVSVESNIGVLEEKLASLSSKRAALETQVVMLRPASLNKDLAEERIRHVLGYHYPDEIAVIDNVSY